MMDQSSNSESLEANSSSTSDSSHPSSWTTIHSSGSRSSPEASIDKGAFFNKCTQCKVKKVTKGPWAFDIIPHLDDGMLKKHLIPLKEMEKDSSVLVLKDDEYLRAYVIQKVSQGWKVEFLEHGSTGVVQLGDCFEIPNALRMPVYATCKLQGLPKAQSDVICERFKNIVMGKHLDLSVKKRLLGNIFEVYLELNGYSVKDLLLQTIYEEMPLYSSCPVVVDSVHERHGILYLKKKDHEILSTIEAATASVMAELPYFDKPFVGEPCVYYPTDNAPPKRGLIIELNEANAIVFLVDHGTEVSVPIEELSQSTPSLVAMAPAFSIPCLLAQLGTFNPDDIYQWISDKHCVVKVLGYKSVILNGIKKHVKEVLVIEQGTGLMLHDAVRNSMKKARFSPTVQTQSSLIDLDPANLKPGMIYLCALTNWVSSQDFSVNLAGTKQMKQLENKLEEARLIPAWDIITNNCYLYKNSEGLHRICILSQDGNLAKIKLFDSGIEMEVQKKELKMSTKELSCRLIPTQAIRCCLVSPCDIAQPFENGEPCEIKFIMKEGRFWRVRFLVENFKSLKTDCSSLSAGVDETDCSRNDTLKDCSVSSANTTVNRSKSEDSSKRMKKQPPLEIGDKISITYASGGITWVLKDNDLLTHVNYDMQSLNMETSDSWKLKDLCVVKCIHDNLWYRSVINEIGDDGIRVYFLDYGNFNVVPKTRIVNISEELLRYPPLAYKCLLPFEVNKASNSSTVYEITSLVKSERSDVYKLDVKTVTPKKDLSSVAYELDVIYDLVPVMIHKDGTFTVHLKTFQTRFAEMSASIQEFVENFDTNLRNEVGALCLAPYSGDDMWYRAKITAVNDDKATVQYVDYANEEERFLSNLKVLPQEWYNVPSQAITCGILHNAHVIKNPKLSFHLDLYRYNLSGRFVSTNEGLALADAKADGQCLIDVLVAKNCFTQSDLTPKSTETLPPFLYQEGEHLNVIIVHVETNGIYWIQRTNSAISKMVEDWAALVDSGLSTPADDPLIGSHYLGFSEHHKSLYRCQLIEVSLEYYRVQYIDYGNHENIQILYEIPKDCLKDPPEAVSCSFVPSLESGGVSGNAIWSTKFNGVLTKQDDAYVFTEWKPVSDAAENILQDNGEIQSKTPLEQELNTSKNSIQIEEPILSSSYQLGPSRNMNEELDISSNAFLDANISSSTSVPAVNKPINEMKIDANTSKNASMASLKDRASIGINSSMKRNTLLQNSGSLKLTRKQDDSSVYEDEQPLLRRPNLASVKKLPACRFDPGWAKKESGVPSDPASSIEEDNVTVLRRPKISSRPDGNKIPPNEVFDSTSEENQNPLSIVSTKERKSFPKDSPIPSRSYRSSERSLKSQNMSLESIKEETYIDTVEHDGNDGCVVTNLIDLEDSPTRNSEIFSNSGDSFISKENQLNCHTETSEISQVLHELSISAGKAIHTVSASKVECNGNSPEKFVENLESIISLASKKDSSTEESEESVQDVLDAADAQMDALRSPDPQN